MLTNVTSGMGVLSVMGPRSRELLQSLTPDDMSDAAFPFATSRSIELGYALVRASRITYVGELGWELYVPTEFMQGVYDELVAAGAQYGLVHAGYHALNSLRIEKAYRHWGHDITDEDTPLGGGLGLCRQMGQARRLHRPRGACCGKRTAGCASGWCSSSSSPPEPLLYHNEPIWRGDAHRRIHPLRHVCPYLGRGGGLGLRDGRRTAACVESGRC